MTWHFAGIFLTLVSGIPGLFCRRESRGGEVVAMLLCLAGCLSGLIAIGQLLVTGKKLAFSLPWAMPGGALILNVDFLSATFLIPLFLVVGCGAIYGLEYWPQAEHQRNGRKLRLFYGLISGAMVLLLTAANAMLFLMAWEVMAIAGYFLINTEDDKPEVRTAGYTYLIATHCGTLALFGMFSLLGMEKGSLIYPLAGSLPAVGSGLIFLLGLFGFGMKAGIMPLHIWLPGAHASAPSHASALLSGVMIKTGIYGLVRLTSFFRDIPPWWGWTLLALGIISGIMGVALALAQHDIKRLLAYHSVENIGIIVLGLGLALLGRSYHLPELVGLGLAGCLLHVANHGLFKSILFFTAGAVIHGVGTRDMDHYGGLLKRLPWTGALFLGGAVAICGLPPFNGFVSEWLIYLGAFQPLKETTSALGLAVLAAPALALIGGLALACFVKVFGVTFLGEPRTPAASHAHEVGLTMLWPTAVLLLACGWIGLLPNSLRPLLQGAVNDWANLSLPQPATALAPLGWVGLAAGVLIGLCLLLFWVLRRWAQAAPRQLGTWGCAYQFGTPRMQYTASSFGDFLVGLFHFGLLSKKHGRRVKGLFARPARFSSHTPDAVLDHLLVPVFGAGAFVFQRLRALVQNGSIAIYLLYVLLVLLGLLAFITR